MLYFLNNQTKKKIFYLLMDINTTGTLKRKYGNVSSIRQHYVVMVRWSWIRWGWTHITVKKNNGFYFGCKK
uniref:Uncharacterized protein n=1 Tax=Meloidogyne enterolobii TaxID=390850 RepID=A0A6V7U340_MELEN|nr:unnamed protein product [Meloidogyne enterolobii]